MPGYTTHYLFGADAFHSLKCTPLKRNLYYNRAAYALGLQGPDIFFYYFPSYLIHKTNIGALAHNTKTGAFYQNLLKSRQLFTSSANRKIADAYLTGFLGHYTLDTICHPYIYAKTNYNGYRKDYFSKHAYLEVDIDTALLAQKLQKKPSEFQQAKTIALTFSQRMVIAKMLHFAYTRTYPTYNIRLITMVFGIYAMQIGLTILHDKTGQKKVLGRFLERKLLGFPNFSPLIASDTLHFCGDPFNRKRKTWANPWAPSLTSNATFYELYQQSLLLFQDRIRLLNHYLRCPDHSDCSKRALDALLAEYGNRSFHSGLEL